MGNAISKEVHLEPIERAAQNALILGLFLPIQSGAWSPSTAPREHLLDFRLQRALYGAGRAAGFRSGFRTGAVAGQRRLRRQDASFATSRPIRLLVTAGLAALTKRIILISTVHVLYGWHPLHLAKFGATIDNMSGGRWGLNVVTGYKKSEFEMFGLEPMEHDFRYEMADEFTTVLERLWLEDDEISLDGRFWKMKNAYVSPKPVNGRCILVNAASSGAGLAYAVRHSDLIFVTSPVGADPQKACEALPPHNAKIKDAAKAAWPHGAYDHQSPRHLSRHGKRSVGPAQGNSRQPGSGRRRQFLCDLRWRGSVLLEAGDPRAMGDRRKCASRWHAGTDCRLVYPAQEGGL